MRVKKPVSVAAVVVIASTIVWSSASAAPQGPWVQTAADLSLAGQDAFGPQIATAPDGSATAIRGRANGSTDIIQAGSTTQPLLLLSVEKIGSGFGTVVSSPAGIDCRKDCSEGYLPYTKVTLTANPESGNYPESRSTFEGWGGACESAVGKICQLTMLDDLNATAYFGAARLKLTKIRPKRLRVKRREMARLRTTAKNSGDGKAKNAKLCINVRRGVRKKVEPKGKTCKKLGDLIPGQTKTRSFKVKATRKARKGRKYKVIFILTAANAGAIDDDPRIKVR